MNEILPGYPESRYPAAGPRKTGYLGVFGLQSEREDGVISELLTPLKSPTRYFVEIGTSDGLENNSSYLDYVKKYIGVMVEGKRLYSRNAQRFLPPLNLGVRYIPARRAG